ncbi:hypothetical protein [Nostoc sp.]
MINRTYPLVGLAVDRGYSENKVNGRGFPDTVKSQVFFPVIFLQ